MEFSLDLRSGDQIGNNIRGSPDRLYRCSDLMSCKFLMYLRVSTRYTGLLGRCRCGFLQLASQVYWCPEVRCEWSLKTRDEFVQLQGPALFDPGIGNCTGT